jgi:two-component system chemotaxis response regulator CheB
VILLEDSMPIKVLIVDDSALIRSLLTELINRQPDMTVVGIAPDPYIARERIKTLNPDVLTLDVEMPRMDGLVFLEKLMRLRPMPVVMVSSLTEKSSEITLRALELGAFDYVTKPKIDISKGLHESCHEIVEKIRGAASAKISNLGRRATQMKVEKKNSADVVLPSLNTTILTTEKLVIIGASTGGTEALKDVLMAMPADSPGILITQHMPAAFTSAFANRLDRLCRITVKEARDGDRVLPGHAYIAPGDRHLLLDRSGANYITRIADGPPVSRHRPSVDVLFRSAANCGGKNCTGVILTGMGDDGATGMLEMKQAGAHTIAQDEASCVVFGMPKEAIARGGVDEIAPLSEIPRRITNCMAVNGQRIIRV